MTLTSLLDLCKRQSGNRTADAEIGFTNYLNIMQREVAAAFPDPEELRAVSTPPLSLANGTESYSLASDFVKFRGQSAMYITSPTANEKVIYPVNEQVFRGFQQVTSNDSRSVPEEYYFSPSSPTTVYFWPIPDASYTATYEYIKDPTDLSATNTTPWFAARWHHILADGALAMYYESPSQRKYDVATYHWTKFRNGKDQLVADLGTKNMHATAQISYGTGVNE